MWQVIQAFDWGMFSVEALKCGSRAPTRDELSAMTQLAIAGGANGIFYLSTTALASPVNGAEFHRRWADVLAAANEVKANGSIRTQMLMRPDADNFWINCMGASIRALDLLASVHSN